MKSICSLYLSKDISAFVALTDSKNTQVTPAIKTTLKLSLSEQALKKAKSAILIERIWANEGLYLPDILEYLTLHNVKHVLDVDKQVVVILPEGTSKLNHFAHRILKMSEAFQSQGHRIEPTELIFNSKDLKSSKSRGAFVTRYIQPDDDNLAQVDPEFSEAAVVINHIELSIASIIALGPTGTEFHELIHWKSFLQRLKLKVNTLSFGSINIMDPSSIYTNDFSVRYFFSLEEFHAHLVNLNKNLRDFSEEPDENFKEDIAFEFNENIATLVHYAKSVKPLLETFFHKSAFISLDSFIEDPTDVLGLSASFEELEVVRFNWVEQFALFYPQGAQLGVQALEYQMSNYEDASWISVVLPLPKGHEDIQDFRDLLKPENKDAFRFINKALFYKMTYLLKLINYIEDLNIKFQMLGSLPDSPIDYFYELDRQYKDKIQN